MFIQNYEKSPSLAGNSGCHWPNSSWAGIFLQFWRFLESSSPYPGKSRRIPGSGEEDSWYSQISEEFPFRKSLVSDIQNSRQATGIFHNFRLEFFTVCLIGGVVETGKKFIVSVVDTDEQFLGSVVDTGKKFRLFGYLWPVSMNIRWKGIIRVP